MVTMFPRFQQYIIATFTIVSFSVVAYAQGIPTGLNGLSLSASTDNPIPGQIVTITARSYSTDINAAKISWTVNGKAVQSGIGLTTLDVNAPSLGSKLSIVVTGVGGDGSVFTNTIVVGSGSVDMILENDGYTPPFFPGKIPESLQNNVTIIAFPHIANSSGTEYDPKTLIYQWKKNDTVLEDQSGYGKQAVTLSGDLVPRPYTVSVSVTPRGGGAQALGQISVNPQSPWITFYRSDPLYGPLFNQAIIEAIGIGTEKETSVLAVPFGFNKPVGSTGSLSLSWLINNIEHPELASHESIVIRTPSGDGGSSQIELDAKNDQLILQGAQAGFSVQFSANQDTTSSSFQ